MFNNFYLLDFYKKYVSQETYPRIQTHLIKMTIIWDHIFLMKHVKCTSRSRITDGHLESSLRVATSSMMTDIGKLIGGK
ncbi:hypothetical protein PR048_019942 [Dryococelus australis]|uniref:Uncharacterized protein n=1 Tax=Dryococelus australis TaxID=614101 RepID=A0ABQ9H4W1_9NEOP|nr:hypothetical protein PR048_019942 [Dryococelus australis]